MKNTVKILEKYFPVQAVSFVTKVLEDNKLTIKFTKVRVSKRGDYRPPVYSDVHIITLSFDTNKYQVLLTFLHEYAHLLTWNKYKNSVLAHGKEWKREFQSVLLDAISLKLFPEDIEQAIFEQYLSKETFSAQHNTNLDNILRKYDTQKKTLVEDVPVGEIFTLSNGMSFIKGEKLRKRYKCVELKTKKVYTIHAFAEVKK